MPFHQRSVEPARLRRPEEAALARAGDPPLFRSLEQVSSHTLVCLLSQLADLSRCAGDIFGELEGQAAALGHRTAELHRRLDALHAAAARLDHRRVKIPVSNLDEESRWTVHYTAPWHQQENVFLPATRPPCVEDLHRQAKLNLKSVLRECDKLRRDGCRSSQYYSQGPTFAASSSPGDDDYQDEDAEPDRKCSLSSSEEERFIGIRRPKTPTSGDFSDLHTQTNWTKSLPLPTPEEKTRQQAQTVQADVVPINITGENFDRQASLRRSLIYTDTLVRRPKKVKRRKTISGIPDILQKELASAAGQGDDGSAQSLYIPDHYSTLGRLDSYRSTGQCLETRDSSCQTEDVKVIPPSMRRIRAHKGVGIAAQMNHLSGSSGNMSVLSDSAGIVFPSRLNSDTGFHSLPRTGTRASTYSLEARTGALGAAEDTDDTFPYQGGSAQAQESFAHLGGASSTGMLSRPKSQQLRFLESPACVVSPHAAYSTSVIPNATLLSSSEVIAIHTAQSAGQLDSRTPGSSSYSKIKPRDRPTPRCSVKDGHHSPRHHWNEGHVISSQALAPGATTLSSLRDSELSLNAPANRENGSQAIAYHCRNNLSFPAASPDVDGKSESSYSGDRGSSEPWEYKGSSNGQASPLKPHPATPGGSTPTSNMSSCSLDQSSLKDDARSLYSEDHDGYYMTTPSDSRPEAGSLYGISDGFGNPRHSMVNVFDGRAPRSQGDQATPQDKTLSRNISLKKAKKPPLPPSRTDSLRRIPKKSSQTNGQTLNESLIASLQHSLQLSLPGKGGSSPSQSPCSDFEEPWLPRSRSQSIVSEGSSLTSTTTPNVYSLCGVTPSQSDTSSVKSEYTDPWGYYIDYTSLQDDPGNPSGVCSAHSSGEASTGNGPVRHIQEASRVPAPQGPGSSVKPKITSPEKSQRVTSPSSGYSSQSNTPTALTPVPVFLKSMSPANGKGKAKPKVPERKSSLISSMSISSSSTSLSSNTSTEGSGTMKKLDSALASVLAPPPPPLPPLPSPCVADNSPFLPPPPPLADCSEGSPLPPSPMFPPPPPPEALVPFCSPSDRCLSPPPTAVSPSLPRSSPPLPAPPPFLPSLEPPPAPPLDPKFAKESRPLFKNSSQSDSSRESHRRPANKEEGCRPPMPLITTEALQMVQLRPVRKNSGAEEVLFSEPSAQEQRTPTAPQYPLKPSAFLKSRNSINEMESESQAAPVTSSLPMPAKSQSQGDHDSAVKRGGLQSCSDGAPGPGPSLRTTLLPDSSPSRKPPPISKKPKLFLVVPPPQRAFAAEPTESGSEAFLPGVPSPTRAEGEAVQSQEEKSSPASRAGSHATAPTPSSPALEGGTAGTLPPGIVEANAPMVQPNTSPDPTQEESGETSVDGERNAKSCLSQQGSEAGLLEPNTAASSSDPVDSAKEEGGDEVLTPTKPRTTEDLFAAIHRSKRKVLGRKDSEDDHTRNHSPSPPVTPTSAAPNLASPKQVGSIQRSMKKSITSSDNFKALLLKKGSRSDTSARMSAAEMLKSTDPRFQRSRSEPSPDIPDSPSSCSPNKNRRAQEEWAKNEGLMPRSLSFSGPRYSRSRTPPSAASSRYSMRNRIQSSPMTVISEGEGEPAEPVDSKARRAPDAAGVCALDRLAGQEMDRDSLLCSGEPASLDGVGRAEGTRPSEQCAVAEQKS